ncbi:MAG TPA: hypothetical protein VFF52_26925, partial [Isosphaeraceae bacterium]|nr:hypothetical protein [Isosphaeraceae bacterium]
AFMERHTAYHRSSNSGLKKHLEYELQKLDQEIKKKTAELKKLVEMDGLEVAGVRPGTEGGEKNVDPAVQPAVHVVTAEQLARLTDRLIQVDLDLIDARARLEAARFARDQGQAKLRELEAAVEEAKRRRIGYTQYLERLKVERKNQELSTKLVEQDLVGLKQMQGSITEKLKQLDFEIGQDSFRVRLLDRAREPKIPANRVRLRLMAVAAIGVVFLILGVFSLSEIRAGRAAGPAPSEPPA